MYKIPFRMNLVPFEDDKAAFAQFLTLRYNPSTVTAYLKALDQAHEASDRTTGAPISPFNMARLCIISSPPGSLSADLLQDRLNYWMNPLAYNHPYTDQVRRNIRVILGKVAEYILLGQDIPISLTKAVFKEVDYYINPDLIQELPPTVRRSSDQNNTEDDDPEANH